MSDTQLAERQAPSALATLAANCSVDPDKLFKVLKETVFKGAKDEELLALVAVSNSYGLNPLTKEIYAFPAKGGGIVPVVSVDGWIRMANNHKQFDGVQFSDLHEDGKLIAVTCRIHRKDRAHPTEVTEYLAECKRSTDPWKMEHRMLRHKAFIQCARVAFGFSGIHDEDEARDIVEKPASARVVDEPVVPEPRQRKPKDVPTQPSLTELREKIAADKLDADKVTAWLTKSDMPALVDLTDDEAAQVLAAYDTLREACK